MRWGLFLLLCLLASTMPALIVYCNHTVPLEECSEVYRRYRDTPGLQASFIQKKQINDTLCLDMTLLVADDSSAFVQLLKTFGKSEEFIADLMSSILDEDIRFVGRVPRGQPELPRDPDDSKNDVMAVFPGRKMVAFFHIIDSNEINSVFLSNFYRTFQI
jgi:hypothetical protein